MKTKLAAAFLFLLPFYGKAQGLIETGAYIRSPDAFSFTANNASLASITNSCFGVFAEKRYLLADLSYYNVAAAFHTVQGNFGIDLKYGGGKSYNESSIGIAYARVIEKKLSAGIKFNYHGIRIPGYRTASAVTGEAGAILQVTAQLKCGVQINNPVGGKLGEDKLPAVYKFGLGYEPSPNFYCGFEIIKEEDRPLDCIANLQYKFVNRFFARVGIVGATMSTFFSAGITWNSFRIDLTVSYHPFLGYSPGVIFIVHRKAGK